MDDSPAHEAGIERGDVILRYDGQDVDEMRNLPAMVSSTPIGKKVKVELLRDGKTKTVKVKIGRLEDTEQLASTREPQDLDELGLEVQDTTPAVMERYGLSSSEGVVVTGVRPVSPAADAGLRPGDVILEIGSSPVKNARDLQERLEDADKAVLLIGRGNSTLFMTISRS
jgi:serine protease Do